MSNGQLKWGIKTSLVNYVEKLEDGKVVVIEPATREAREFIFELDSEASNFDQTAKTGWLQFRGGVTLSGHWDSLNVTVIDPLIEIENDRASLGISVGGVIAEPHNEVIARGDFNRETGAIELFLTQVGQNIFGPQYQVGQQIDSAHLVL
ncbi:MAG: HtaA domain-containing protein [Micrococcales bacterium]